MYDSNPGFGDPRGVGQVGAGNGDDAVTAP
jgi:hypothetical protein